VHRLSSAPDSKEVRRRGGGRGRQSFENAEVAAGENGVGCAPESISYGRDLTTVTVSKLTCGIQVSKCARCGAPRGLGGCLP
jgi:hypothetical protein